MAMSKAAKAANGGSVKIPRVYSYTRFSTDEQKKGDSNRRQDDKAQAWAERKGCQLDESLKDEGLSGYHGTNRKHGALGRFLQRIKGGDVESGSILLVENIDRLSREDFLQAFEIISQIVNAGVTIVTLEPYAEYDRQTISGGLIWQLVGQMQRAYEESERKSRLIRASRDQARKLARLEGRVMTAMCPAWLKPKPDRIGFETINDAAATIRRIYDWASEGVSLRRIEAQLNKESAWMPPSRLKAKRAAGLPGNGWRVSYITKLLHNRAVLGEYQPYVLRSGKGGPRTPEGEPIPDHYPRIISPELFFAVQERLAGNKRTGGRTGKVSNVLTHMVVCAYCGGPMRFVDKGKPPKGAEYLICDRGARGVECKSSNRIRYDEAVNVVLDNCRFLRPEDVLPQEAEQEATRKELTARLAGLQGEDADLDQKLSNLTERVEDAPKGIVERLYARITEITERQRMIADQSRETRRALTVAESSLQTFCEWKEGLAALKTAIVAESPDLRLRLRSHLRTLIAKIEVYATGYSRLYDDDLDSRDKSRMAGRRCTKPAVSDDIVNAVYDAAAESELKLTDEFCDFVRDLAARRMTREGRFLRVWCHNGAVFDFVPPGSLASGLQAVGTSYQSAGPDLGQLWGGYQARSHARRKKTPRHLAMPG